MGLCFLPVTIRDVGGLLGIVEEAFCGPLSFANLHIIPSS